MWCAGCGRLSNWEIAREMRLSENTVKNYAYRIFNKLGVSNRVEVVMHAASQRTNLPSCRSVSVPQLAEVAIHVEAAPSSSVLPTLVFPKMLVCLNCGFVEFSIPEDELQSITKAISAQGKEIER